MIPNITRGSRMSGLMVYLASTDENKTKNAHTDPHLVAGDAARIRPLGLRSAVTCGSLPKKKLPWLPAPPGIR